MLASNPIIEFVQPEGKPTMEDNQPIIFGTFTKSGEQLQHVYFPVERVKEFGSKNGILTLRYDVYFRDPDPGGSRPATPGGLAQEPIGRQKELNR